MVRYHMTVFGDVQGVGFRYFVAKSASLYGITGWVMNKYDGTVEIDAEGKEVNMTEFVNAIKRGNMYSDIECVDIEEMKDLENYKSFGIEESY